MGVFSERADPNLTARKLVCVDSMTDEQKGIIFTTAQTER
jgi:hypothetical protein